MSQWRRINDIQEESGGDDGIKKYQGRRQELCAPEKLLQWAPLAGRRVTSTKKGSHYGLGGGEAKEGVVK